MKERSRILILYGSQTFTAQEIAERIWRITKVLGFEGPVQAMDDYPISQLIREEFAIFVCSTTGQGDEPDNMKRFWKFLLRKNLPTTSLQKLNFGVLGLGDSTYTKFNFVGKRLYKRLIQLGAQPLIDIGLCDYQHDLGHDAVMTPWLEQIFTKLKLYFPHIHNINLKDKFVPKWKVSLLKEKNILTEENLLQDIYFSRGCTNNFLDSTLLQVDQNLRTTVETHFQDVRLITFKSSNSVKLEYEPGDIFNIRPRNSKRDIDDLFEIFDHHNMDIKPNYRLLVEEYHKGNKKILYIYCS